MVIRIWTWPKMRPYAVLGVIFGLGMLACMHSAFAADCPGHPDAIGTSGPSWSIRRSTAGSAPWIMSRACRSTTMRWCSPSTTARSRLFQQGAGHSRLAMREGQLLHGRRDGEGLSGDGQAQLRRRPHHRHPQQTHPLRFRAGVGRAGNAQIDDGIAAVGAALGRRREGRWLRSFAFPASAGPSAAEQHAAERGLMVWGAEFRPTTG